RCPQVQVDGCGRQPRGAPHARSREGGEGGLRLRELRLARGARGVRRRGARRPGMRRVVVSGLLLAFVGCALGLYVVASQPPWFERIRYLLRYSEYVRVHARQNGIDPALLAAVIYQESKFDAG